MREIKFRSFNKETKIMKDWEYIHKVRNIHKLITLNHVVLMQFTGFKDSHGIDIYEGDIISDWVDTDQGMIQSGCQVFWNEFTGSWYLDHSHKQDKTYSSELWQELNDFKYEVTGNIYEVAKNK